MTHDTFPQCNLFPLEIRRQIWKACLHRRIAEEDIPFTLLDGKESRQACWPVRTVLLNARVPLLVSVNSEARAVVFESGRHQITQDHLSLKPIWLQPKIDRALHVNWTRRRDEEYYRINNAMDSELEGAPVMILVNRANYVYNMRVSIVADYIFQFNLEVLMNCSSPALPDTDSMGNDFMTSAIPQIVMDAAYEDVNRRARDLDDMLCMFYGRENKAIFTTVVAISLHVDREAALASGLFGLQADAPVQTVDCNDLPRLRQFYKLFKSDTALKEAEPHV
ncbi:hypothetical protein IFR04_001805 [Cadophora malorum]|uniref:2EXR domain-containing protein n=1 Tax=Cadophora malorum TaxID=108018 RepID=A0A8H7WHQ2_9HELO|nr:hypothetical protein IFR04_001805 [Cadophora malorum]